MVPGRRTALELPSGANYGNGKDRVPFNGLPGVGEQAGSRRKGQPGSAGTGRRRRTLAAAGGGRALEAAVGALAQLEHPVDGAARSHPNRLGHFDHVLITL